MEKKSGTGLLGDRRQVLEQMRRAAYESLAGRAWHLVSQREAQRSQNWPCTSLSLPTSLCRLSVSVFLPILGTPPSAHSFLSLRLPWCRLSSPGPTGGLKTHSCAGVPGNSTHTCMQHTHTCTHIHICTLSQTCTCVHMYAHAHTWSTQARTYI